MSRLSDRQREGIVWAAEREIPLKLGKEPIRDPQICGGYDIYVGAKYLGWTSKKGKLEARALHEATPSKLKDPKPQTRDEQIVFQVELALKRCGQIESDHLSRMDQAMVDQVGVLRAGLEVLFERVCQQ